MQCHNSGGELKHVLCDSPGRGLRTLCSMHLLLCRFSFVFFCYNKSTAMNINICWILGVILAIHQTWDWSWGPQYATQVFSFLLLDLILWRGSNRGKRKNFYPPILIWTPLCPLSPFLRHSDTRLQLLNFSHSLRNTERNSKEPHQLWQRCLGYVACP